MHIEQIDFDEVFDIQAARGDFSFRSRGRAHYGANLQNRVIPRPGSRFAVAFATPGDWPSVIGSRDLASSEVVLARPTWMAFLLQAGDFFVFGLPFIVGTLVFGGSWPGLVLAALLALAIAYVIVRGLRVNRAATQALLGIGQNDIRGDKGSPAPQTACNS